MKGCVWLGLGLAGVKREVFVSAEEPTTESHGHAYHAVIGPFRTLRGARFMRDHGRDNPHCITVADAESLASKETP